MSGRASNAVDAILGGHSSTRTDPPRGKGHLVKTGIGVLDAPADARVHVGELVEVVGVSSAGKTQLLHVLAATALQDAERLHKPVVCWFDLNGGLDLKRIKQMKGKPKKNTHGIVQEGADDEIPGLRVYHPGDTLALCSSLHALLSFFSTPEGSQVTTVIIDALGIFHYSDRHYKSISEGKGRPPGAGTNEFVLVNVLKQLLDCQRVAVFASKCALYDETTLSAEWPFSEAGAPSIPGEFMPSSWSSLVSHTLLIYHTMQNPNLSPSMSESDTVRGLVALVRKRGLPFRNQMQVTAASVVVIDENGVSAQDGQIHTIEQE